MIFNKLYYFERFPFGLIPYGAYMKSIVIALLLKYA